MQGVFWGKEMTWSDPADPLPFRGMIKKAIRAVIYFSYVQERKTIYLSFGGVGVGGEVAPHIMWKQPASFLTCSPPFRTPPPSYTFYGIHFQPNVAAPLHFDVAY